VPELFIGKSGDCFLFFFSTRPRNHRVISVINNLCGRYSVGNSCRSVLLPLVVLGLDIWPVLTSDSALKY
jgi:hypothetical protein